MSFQTTLMEALKARYIEGAGLRQFGGCASASQAPYYLGALEDNLVMPMNAKHVAEYSRGSGGELGGKMKALRSSSAMTFNLLGNGPIDVHGDDVMPAGLYSVEYEHQLPTLKGNTNPANLDAKLELLGGSCVVYCEMKLAEWLLGRAGGLRPAYLDSENYLVSQEPSAMFVDLFESLTCDEIGKDGRLKPKHERYDALQMAKHLLAIYSHWVGVVEGGGRAPERIVLANCIWEMTHPEKLGTYEGKYRELAVEEHAQFGAFAEKARPIATLFGGLGCSFELRYYSFSQFMGVLDLDERHVRALQRYMV